MVGHFVTIRKPDPKSVRKMAIWKLDNLDFGRSLYLGHAWVGHLVLELWLELWSPIYFLISALLSQSFGIQQRLFWGHSLYRSNCGRSVYIICRVLFRSGRQLLALSAIWATKIVAPFRHSLCSIHISVCLSPVHRVWIFGPGLSCHQKVV